MAIFSEAVPAFFLSAGKFPLDTQERRRLLGSPLRYCIAGDNIYMPAEQEGLPELGQLSWASLPSDVAMDIPLVFGQQLPKEWCIDNIDELGCYVGDRYIKRRKETKNGMVNVATFGAEELIKSIQKNSDALDDVSKHDFEALCAEIFVSRGFQVDLFRQTKDDGIDFLAIDDGNEDPVVYAISCKHPDLKTDGSRKTVGPKPVREIFGVSSAFGFGGAVTITSGKFTRGAKSFSKLNNSKIKLEDHADLLKWISNYRWNEDEES